MEKVSVGVPGMDILLKGGIPKGKVVLLSGSSGTGKTIFASQFIQEGVKLGEKGVFITLEESKEKLIEDLKQLGIDFKEMEKKNKIRLVGGPIGHVRFFKEKTKANMYDIIDEVKEIINGINAKRVVLDSINLFTMLFESDLEKRRALADLIATFDQLGVTALMTCEVKEGENAISWYGFEEFVVDGVVVLYRLPFGNIYERAISVVKMRGVNHSQRVVSLEITKNGVVVYPDREPFHEILTKRT